MSKIHLDFAPGTASDCKKFVGQLPPGDIFDAYRLGKQSYGHGDLVIVTTERDPELLEAWPRPEYVKRAVRNGSNLSISEKSAHQIMMLPKTSDAFWFVFESHSLRTAIMCVLHATREQETAGELITVVGN